MAPFTPRTLVVGTAAGLLSLLLAASMLSGTPLAIVLFYLSPLPIMLAALGWKHHAGLVGAGVAALVAGVLASPILGVVHLLAVGLPSWWLAYLALLAQADETGRTTWYPTGGLVFWASLVAACATVAGAVAIGGDYATFEATLRRAFEATFSQLGRTVELPAPDRLPPAAPPPVTPPAGTPPAVTPPASGAQPDPATLDAMARLFPALVAPMLAGLSLLNLALAARIARASGRLPRPAGDVAAGLTLPRRDMLVGLGLALLLASVGEGFAGLLGRVTAGTLAFALMLQGLALLHLASRGFSARGVLIALLYVGLMILPPVPVALVALGLADLVFDLRRRLPPPASTV